MLGEYVVRTLNAVSVEQTYHVIDAGRVARAGDGVVTRHFLVIGAQRCGTTWLHHQLEAHPEIAMARPTRPEPKVFLDATSARGRTATGTCDTWFAHATPEAGPRREEHQLPRGPRRHRARPRPCSGDARIVVQLRDPVARAVSNWRFSTENGLEKRSLEEALPTNLDGPLPWDPAVTSVSPYAYLERGRYVDLPCGPGWHAFGDLRARAVPRGAAGGPGGLADDVDAHAGRRPAHRRRGRPATRSTQSADPRARPRRGAREPRLREYFQESDRELEALLGTTLPVGDRRDPRRAAGTDIRDGLQASSRTRSAFNVPVDRGQRDRLPRAEPPRRAHVLVRALQRSAPRRSSQDDSGAQEVMLTTSCTAALELSRDAAGPPARRHRVVPSFTFTTTALAFARQGAELLFCDIEPRTLGLDPAAPRRAPRRSRARRGGRPLRRGRLRHRRDPRGAGRAARRRADRGQRPRALRPLAGPAAGQLRRVRHA